MFLKCRNSKALTKCPSLVLKETVLRAMAVLSGSNTFQVTNLEQACSKSGWSKVRTPDLYASSGSVAVKLLDQLTGQALIFFQESHQYLS